MPKCPQCGRRMSYNDETTRLTEFVCSNCHRLEIEWKETDVQHAA